MKAYKFIFLIAAWLVLIIFALVVFQGCGKKADPLGRTCWECEIMPHAFEGRPTGSKVAICLDSPEAPTQFREGTKGYGVNNCKLK